MKTLLLLAAASIALMACQQQTTAEAGNDVEGVAVNAADPANPANVVLPPSITATKTYRCKDSSVVHIDWLSDNQSANLRADDTATPVQLKAAVAGEAMTAEGYSLTGDATSATIDITRPNISAQSCKG